MGYETECRVVTRSQTGERREAHARVLLETDHLIVRGAARVKIALRSIVSVRAEGGTVTVLHPDGVTTLALGTAATTWAKRLTAPPKSLLDKLGVKSGSRVSLVGMRDLGFLADLATRTPLITQRRAAPGSDLIFLGVEHARDLTRIARLGASLAPTGALWAVHRKGPQGITDVAIFAAGAAAGLTATKVVRFSETHTGEKLVIPLALR